MAKVNNTEAIQKLVDELKLQPGSDLIPTEVAEKIIPTFQINSEEIQVKNPTATIVRSAKATTDNVDVTIYAVPSSGKFYLTNVALSYSAPFDSNDNNAEAYVEVFIDGTQQKIAWISLSSATGQKMGNNSVCLNLQNPVLVDAGTNITIQNEFGSGFALASIVGYTES